MSPPSHSDEEWEYEYHPTETETFYVTLDLSSNLENQPDNQTINEDGLAAQPQLPFKARPAEYTGSENARDAVTTTQILDFHSQNPIVVHEGRVYSCSWASTVGTDLTLASADTELSFAPLHRGDGYQIVSQGAVRLVGTPAELRPRVNRRDGTNLQSDSASQTSSSLPTDAQEQNGVQAETMNKHVKDFLLSIPVGEISSEDREQQAEFLATIAAIKRQRGDKDEIPIYRGKRYSDFLPSSSSEAARAQSSMPPPPPPVPQALNASAKSVATPVTRRRKRTLGDSNDEGSSVSSEWNGVAVPLPSTERPPLPPGHMMPTLSSLSPVVPHQLQPRDSIPSSAASSQSRSELLEIPESSRPTRRARFSRASQRRSPPMMYGALPEPSLINNPDTSAQAHPNQASDNTLKSVIVVEAPPAKGRTVAQQLDKGQIRAPIGRASNDGGDVADQDL